MKADWQSDEGFSDKTLSDPLSLHNLTIDQKAEFAFRLLCTLPLEKTRQVVDRLQPILCRDCLSSMPTEIALKILFYLDLQSLQEMRSVSKYWNSTSQDHILWKHIFLEKWTVNQAAIDRYLTYQPFRKLCRATENAPKSINGYTLNASLAPTTKCAVDIIGQSDPALSQREQHKNKEAISHVIVERFADKPRSSRCILNHNEVPYLYYDEYQNKHYINWHRLYEDRSKIALRWKKLQYVRRIFPLVLDPWRSGTRVTITSTLPLQFPSLRSIEYQTIENASEQSNSGIYCLQFNDRILVTGSRDRCISIWSTKVGLLKQKLRGHSGSVLCLHFDSKYIISGGSDSRLIVWDLLTGKRLKTLVGHSDSVLNVKFANNLVVSCSKDMTIRTWDWKKDDRRVISIDDGSSTKCGGTMLRTFWGHHAAVNAVQFKGDRIVSASGDRTIKIWDLNTGECLKTLDLHSRGIACVEYDGKYIVSGSSDQTIRVWNAVTGESLRTLIGHTDLVRTLQINSSTRTIVSGSYDGTVKIWDLESGKLMTTLSQTTHGRILNLQFDFTKIICCTNFGKIVVYDFAYGVDTQFMKS